MDLKQCRPGVRALVLAIWTLVLGALYFVFLPGALAHLNEALGWSRWNLPGARVIGPGLIAAGLCLVAYCSYLFHRMGRGSIVPIDPTQELVVVGPFLYSRNPVFAGYLSMLVGIFVISGAATLLVYVLAFRLYLEIFIRREESDLLQRFGEDYRAYVRSVPRWFGPRARGARRPTSRCR
jgi:protein-S-isoprenylcysteine O-methyltransferase Ste14